jgi:hypothetical protein
LPSFIRHPKDFWSGVIFILFGLAAVVIARDYTMGSAGRMGPGYFPTILGWMLAAIGAVCTGRSFFGATDSLEKFAVKECILILLAVLLFGFLVREAGLAIAIPVIIILGAIASTKFKWSWAIPLAIGMTVACVLLFVKALGLPMPILGAWFGA